MMLHKTKEILIIRKADRTCSNPASVNPDFGGHSGSFLKNLLADLFKIPCSYNLNNLEASKIQFC